MPRGDANTQHYYITETDRYGVTRTILVERREVRWYCYYCSYGPMSPELDTHCADCGRRRSSHSYVENQEVRRYVAGS